MLRTPSSAVEAGTPRVRTYRMTNNQGHSPVAQTGARRRVARTRQPTPPPVFPWPRWERLRMQETQPPLFLVTSTLGRTPGQANLVWGLTSVGARPSFKASLSPNGPGRTGGTQVSLSLCGRKLGVYPPAPPSTGVPIPRKAQARTKDSGVSAAAWGEVGEPFRKLHLTDDHRLYPCRAARWSVGLQVLQREGRCVTPPIKGLTCCTLRPNAPAAYI